LPVTAAAVEASNTTAAVAVTVKRGQQIRKLPMLGNLRSEYEYWTEPVIMQEAADGHRPK
jgi:hypothetical protein